MIQMKTILLAVSFILFSGVNAQCPNPEKFLKSKGSRDGYGESSQSRSGFVRAGEVYEAVFIAQGSTLYKMTIGPIDKNVGNLKYEIYEMVVEKKIENGKSVYRKEKQVLFSSIDNQPVEFRSDEVRKIYVKVMLEGEDKEQLACVGILIEHKKAVKLGF
jgi:hypothetical protein